MKKMLLAALVASSGALFALPALAAATDAKPAPRAAVLFWLLDRNGDGFIDAAELKAFRTASFAAFDTNGDGSLSKPEAQAAFPAPPADSQRAQRFAQREDRMLKRIGFKDGVAGVAQADFVNRDMPILQRADADHDGKISKAEFEAAAARMRSFMMGP